MELCLFKTPVPVCQKCLRTPVLLIPFFREMYSEDEDPRYTRRQAGYQFEYSDGRFIVIVDMDGDSTFKPVLRVALVPRDNTLLAANIRQQLGLKPSKNTFESDFNYQKTEQHKRQHEDNMPSVGLVQTGSGSSRTLISSIWLLFSTIGFFVLRNALRDDLLSLP